LLTESLLLAAISGAAGLAIGVWVLDLFMHVGPPELLRWQTGADQRSGGTVCRRHGASDQPHFWRRR
jgi:hypothetical protein